MNVCINTYTQRDTEIYTHILIYSTLELMGSRPGPTPTSWPSNSISQRRKPLHPYHGMACIIEYSAQALTSAGVKEN